MSSNSVSDDIDEVVETNTLTRPSKSFESPCVEHSFKVVLTKSYSSESPEFLAKIQHMVSNVFLLIVWSLCLNPMYLHR